MIRTPKNLPVIIINEDTSVDYGRIVARLGAHRVRVLLEGGFYVTVHPRYVFEDEAPRS